MLFASLGCSKSDARVPRENPKSGMGIRGANAWHGLAFREDRTLTSVIVVRRLWLLCGLVVAEAKRGATHAHAHGYAPGTHLAPKIVIPGQNPGWNFLVRKTSI